MLSVKVPANSQAVGKKIRDLDIPSHILIVMIKRGLSVVTPKANTEIQANDILMLASDSKEELLQVAKMQQLKPRLKDQKNGDTEDRLTV